MKKMTLPGVCPGEVLRLCVHTLASLAWVKWDEKVKETEKDFLKFRENKLAWLEWRFPIVQHRVVVIGIMDPIDPKPHSCCRLQPYHTQLSWAVRMQWGDFSCLRETVGRTEQKFSKFFDFYTLLCWSLEVYLTSPSHSRLWKKSSLKRLSYKPLLFPFRASSLPIHTLRSHGWWGTQRTQYSALVLTSFLYRSNAFPESLLNYTGDDKLDTYSNSVFRAVLPPSWAVVHHWNTFTKSFTLAETARNIVMHSSDRLKEILI